MKQLSLIFALLISLVSVAQQTGSIVGKITDKDYNNEPLSFANVLIKGTTKGTTSDIDGLYKLENIEPGDYQIEFSFVGYETQVLSANVVAGKVTEINIPMGVSAASIDEVVISVTTKRESETALLLEQKKAVEMKQSIGAEELSRKGVSDVANAVAKTTGISKQEGSGDIFVRGLGDRYNSTTMNGLPLPTNNPLKKNIDLNIFSTDIVETIDISKTLGAQNYGDVAGASIDIVSKDYTGKGFFEVGLGMGANLNAIDESNFYLFDGPNKTGFYSNDYPNNPLNNYNFTTSWDKKNDNGLNNSFSLTGGKSFNTGDEGRISVFATLNHDNNYTYIEGINIANLTTQEIPRTSLYENRSSYNTNSTGMLNLKFKLNSNHNLRINNLYINSSSQLFSELTGVFNIFDQAPNGGGYRTRSTFTRNQLFVNQLLGEHKISNRFDFDWGMSYNILKNNMPNRRQVTLVPASDDAPFAEQYIFSDLSQNDNHRYYQDLVENEMAGNFALSYKFGKTEEDEYRGKATVGYNVRSKLFDFEATQFNFRINNGVPAFQANPNNIDAFFTQDNLDAGLYQIRTFRGTNGTEDVLDPQTYEGFQDIHATYGSLSYKFSDKFSAIVGLRGDVITQYIEWDTSISQGNNDDIELQLEILPSISMRYALNDKQNIRLAASKSYTLPQYVERAPFLFEFANGTSTFGNENLYTSTDYNGDLKWEFFPNKGEVVSFTAFGKYIENPINEVIIASASNDISWVNSGDNAIAIGGEVEVKLDLFNFDGRDADTDNKLSYGLNLSYMHTEQDVDADKVTEETDLSVNFTNETERLTGASDILGNTDLTYIKEFGKDQNIQATLAVNYFSDRLFAIGSQQVGSIIDDEVFTLDFILKSKISDKLQLGINCRNLTNPRIEQYQEGTTKNIYLRDYRKGAAFSFSLTYKL